MVFTCTSVAAAQGAARAASPTRFAVAVGTTLAGGYRVGDVTADLRRNAVGPAQPFTQLRAESAIDRAAGVDTRVSVRLTPSLALEAAGIYARPRLRVTISADSEAMDGGAASEEVSQYSIDVSGVYLLSRLRVGARMRPYVIGGGGYLRQVPEGRLRIETGGTIHAGAGLSYWLRGGPGQRQRPLGARFEGRLFHRVGGIDFEGKGRTFPALSALAFIGL
jgi:hypothetical protein